MPSLLRNPLVFGGLALLLAAGAGVAVVVVLSEGEQATVAVMPPTETSTALATPTPTPVPLNGMQARSLSTLTVRAGPGTEYISLGIVRRGTELEVVGRDSDDAWLEISYPPRSRLRGWVPAEDVDLEGSMAGLPLATPESLVLPAVPTYPPGTFDDQQPGLSPTPDGAAGPDLVLSDAYLTEGWLTVTVTNQGTAVASSPIDVAVYDGDGSTLLRLARVGDSLAAGASIDLPTEYNPAGGPQRLLILVDPADRVEESNEDNNQILFGVSGPPPTPEAASPPPSATLTPTWRLPRSTPTPTAANSTPVSTPTEAASTPAPTVQGTQANGD